MGFREYENVTCDSISLRVSFLRSISLILLRIASDVIARELFGLAVGILINSSSRHAVVGNNIPHNYNVKGGRRLNSRKADQ